MIRAVSKRFLISLKENRRNFRGCVKAHVGIKSIPWFYFEGVALNLGNSKERRRFWNPKVKAKGNDYNSCFKKQDFMQQTTNLRALFIQHAK